MRVDRLIAAAFAVAVISSSVLAQTRPAAQPAASAAPATASVPPTKVALINTEMFADEKNGIVRMIAAIKRVEGEFATKKTELQQLQTRVNQLTDELNKIQNAPPAAGVDQKSVQLKADQLD